MFMSTRRYLLNHAVHHHFGQPPLRNRVRCNIVPRISRSARSPSSTNFSSSTFSTSAREQGLWGSPMRNSSSTSTTTSTLDPYDGDPGHHDRPNESIQEMEMRIMQRRTRSVLNLPMGQFDPDTWLAMDDLLKWWSVQQNQESVDVSFQLLDRIVAELQQQIQAHTRQEEDDHFPSQAFAEGEYYDVTVNDSGQPSSIAFVDPRVVTSIVRNWYQVWAENQDKQLQQSASTTGERAEIDAWMERWTPRKVQSRIDGHAHALPDTISFRLRGKALTFLFNGALLLKDVDDAAAFCDDLMDRLFEVISDRDSLSVFMVNNTLGLWAKTSKKVSTETRVTRVEELFARAVDMQVPLDLVSYNTLLSVYANAGLVDKAEKIFQALVLGKKHGLEPDEISVHSLALAYANSNQGIAGADRASFLLQRLFDPFDDYGRLGIPVNNVLFNIVLLAYARVKSLEACDKAYELLREMKRMGDMAPPDSVSYGTVIDAYSRMGQPERASIILKEQMEDFDETGKNNLRPTCVSMTLLLNAWANSKSKESPARGIAILEKMLEFHDQGFLADSPDAWSFNAALNCILSVPSSSPSREVAKQATQFIETMQSRVPQGVIWPNSWTYSELLFAFVKRQDFFTVDRFLRQAHASSWIQLDIRTWGRVIIAMAQHGRVQQADKWLRVLMDRCVFEKGAEGTRPFTSLLGAVIGGFLRVAREDPDAAQRMKSLVSKFEHLYEKGYVSQLPDTMVYNGLIAQLTRTSNTKREAYEALQTLQRVRNFVVEGKTSPATDSISYNQVIRALIKVGETDAAVIVLNQMINDHKTNPTLFPAPVSACFASVLEGLSNEPSQGTWKQALEIFDQMDDPVDGNDPDAGRFRNKACFSAMIRLANQLSMQKEASQLSASFEKYKKHLAMRGNSIQKTSRNAGKLTLNAGTPTL